MNSDDLSMGMACLLLPWQSGTNIPKHDTSEACACCLLGKKRQVLLLRRLRENSMLEIDVRPTGEVLKDGRVVGRMEGLRFMPEIVQEPEIAPPQEPIQEGEPAENTPSPSSHFSLRQELLPALDRDLELRAARLAAASDEQFQLSLDGLIRSIGEPVAILKTSEKPLEPGFLLLADEALSVPLREMVETRIALWIKSHIQKVLGGLTALETAQTDQENEKEGGRAVVIAQLLAHFGVVERSSVAQQVRNLDQAVRSELRKLGVRFGTYHIYMPLLMKPGPRALASQLFTLHHNRDFSCLRDISHLAFSGRTSFPHEVAIEKDLYLIAGFKVIAGRAVRIDILERLADLIRPAIAYRPGISEGEPPQGAADGDAFTVTVTMTSLVGCAGVEFAEILRVLGYQSEKRLGNAITVPLKGVIHLGMNEEKQEQEEQQEETEKLEVSSSEQESTPAQEPTTLVSETAEGIEQAEPTETSEQGEQPDVESAAKEPAEIEIWRLAPRKFEKKFDHSRGAFAKPSGPNKRWGDKTFEKNRSAAPASAQQGEAQNEAGKEGETANGKVANGSTYHKKRERLNENPNQYTQRAGDKRDKSGYKKGEDRSNASFNHKKTMGGKMLDRKPPQEKKMDPDSPFAKLMALKVKLEGKE